MLARVESPNPQSGNTIYVRHWVFTARSVAERGIAMINCPSVCPSVCDVGGLWSHALQFFENNFTDDWLIGLCSLQTPTSRIYSIGNTPNFSRNRSGVWKIVDFRPLSRRISEMVRDRIQVAIDLRWHWRATIQFVILCACFSEAITKILMKIDPYYQRRKCSAETLVCSETI